MASRSVFEFGLRATADLVMRSMADYIVSIQFDEERLALMARIDAIDFAASRVLLWNDQPAGVALIARRGWTSRMALLALLPEARKQGLGSAFVRQLQREARERGDRRMVLEVIEQNGPAVRLYDRCGFRRGRRLLGFRAEPIGSRGETRLHEIDLREVAANVSRHPLFHDLPWQVSAETIGQLTPPNRGYGQNGAWAAAASPAGPVVRVRALAVSGEDLEAQAAAIAMLRGIRATYPSYPVEMIALWPEEGEAVWLAAGFKRNELSQFQLSYDFL
ncbi:MAG TPA: GNAT family N-acetyltransferase [Opitutaceae bacterium]